MSQPFGPPRSILQALTFASVEVFLAVLAMLSGLPILATNGELAPITMSVLPDWAVLCWGGVLVLGGLLTLAGIAARAIRIERAGVLLLGSSTIVLFVALLSADISSAVGLVLYPMFAWAMLARYWSLGRVLKSIKAVKATLKSGG